MYVVSAYVDSLLIVLYSMFVILCLMYSQERLVIIQISLSLKLL